MVPTPTARERFFAYGNSMILVILTSPGVPAQPPNAAQIA